MGFEEVKKIELGSGKMPHDGYIHIDIEESVKPDIIGDFRQMTFAGLEEIRAQHLLEHFSREEAIKILRQWHSWLKIGGRIIVETPDIEGVVERFNSNGIWANKEWMVRHLYGSQEADWAFHRDGWYKEKFEKILPELGFKIIHLKQKYSYVRTGPDNTRHRLPNIIVAAEKI